MSMAFLSVSSLQIVVALNGSNGSRELKYSPLLTQVRSSASSPVASPMPDDVYIGRTGDQLTQHAMDICLSMKIGFFRRLATANCGMLKNHTILFKAT